MPFECVVWICLAALLGLGIGAGIGGGIGLVGGAAVGNEIEIVEAKNDRLWVAVQSMEVQNAPAVEERVLHVQGLAPGNGFRPLRH